EYEDALTVDQVEKPEIDSVASSDNPSAKGGCDCESLKEKIAELENLLSAEQRRIETLTAALMRCTCSSNPFSDIDEANGIYRGCLNSAPVDRAVAQCKHAGQSNDKIIDNCYCNNVDFCNSSEDLQCGYIAAAKLRSGSMTHLSTDFVDWCRSPNDGRADTMKLRNVLRFGASSDGPIKQTSLTHVALGLSCMLIALIFRQVSKKFSMTRHGLFCDDDSILYPYKPDTIHPDTVLVVAICLPLIIITFTELFNTIRALQTGILLCRRVFCLFVHPAIFFILKYYTIYLFGLFVCDALTEVGKRTVGRLRPHFVDVCKPNLTLCATNPHLYIADIQCLGIDNDDERASFPSGHSSDSFYVSIFCIMYLQVRLDLRSAMRFIRASFQVILFTIAYYCAMSRVMDNHHRGSDVLAGSLLGALIATSTSELCSGSFTRK
uniref:Phosphatidic acid phosphatase type 2/haloperoxidase domain-containing protein n=1 Tax=Plectus sambesii TaxID=2011161 RepID=A0A914UQA1_9BILA